MHIKITRKKQVWLGTIYTITYIWFIYHHCWYHSAELPNNQLNKYTCTAFLKPWLQLRPTAVSLRDNFISYDLYPFLSIDFFVVYGIGYSFNVIQGYYFNRFKISCFREKCCQFLKRSAIKSENTKTKLVKLPKFIAHIFP